jgi:peptidoglycan-N-acetylglucosamine deacetylase
MSQSSVCLTFDFDALSVWFGYDHVTPAMLQRGEYGARVGVPRLLERLAALDLPATFFIPGHTIESFPAECEAIVAAGNEVAHHSYAHVDPSRQTPDEERADMERALAALEGLGVRPLGYRSPSADMSPATLPLLEEYGFLYDSSLMADDFRPYRPRIGDSVTREQPLVRGREARLWELPMCFELDDWPHFQFAFGPPYRAGLSAPSKVLEIWTESSTGCTATSTAACSPSACTRRSSGAGTAWRCSSGSSSTARGPAPGSRAWATSRASSARHHPPGGRGGCRRTGRRGRNGA